MTIYSMVLTIKRKLKTTIQKIGTNWKTEQRSEIHHIFVVATVSATFGYGFFILLSQLNYWPTNFVFFISYFQTSLLGAWLYTTNKEVTKTNE